MPDGKNQHYVPKHYLRAWADGEETNAFPLSEGKAFPETTTKVCSRSYFYGEPHVEEELGELDGDHAHPLREIRNGDNLTDLSKQRITLLLSFITTQRSRTKATKQDIDEAEEFMRDAVKDDMEAGRYDDFPDWTSDLNEKEKEDSLVEASLLGTLHYIVGQGIFGYHAIQDLNAVMLRNTTGQEFVTSDVPVVLDNPCYKPQYGTTPAGLGHRGLQIFCPIGPNRLLLLYDPEVYDIDYNSRRQLLIKSEDVVDQFNLTQFHNADNTILFYNSDEDYLKQLHSRIDDVRRRGTITMPLETENMETVEIEKTPPFQAPKISPGIPGTSTMTHLQFTDRRPTSQAEKGRHLTRKIFNEAKAPDLGLISSTRFFEEQLDI